MRWWCYVESLPVKGFNAAIDSLMCPIFSLLHAAEEQSGLSGPRQKKWLAGQCVERGGCQRPSGCWSRVKALHVYPTVGELYRCLSVCSHRDSHSVCWVNDRILKFTLLLIVSSQRVTWKGSVFYGLSVNFSKNWEKRRSMHALGDVVKGGDNVLRPPALRR